jgi:hypothetical protein
MITWDQINHFKQREFDDSRYPGSGERINMILVLNLDYLWERVYTISGAKPAIIITQAVDLHGEHGHAGNSYHLAKQGCKAADFFIVTSLSARMQYNTVEKQGFPGIGVYYDWQYKGKPLSIGFHVDLRPPAQIQRWRRVNGEYFYLLGR